MNRKQLEDGLRTNKTNYTFAHDQHTINQHLVRNLAAAKALVDTHQKSYFIAKRFSNFDS
jgi:hypothetical protein